MKNLKYTLIAIAVLVTASFGGQLALANNDGDNSNRTNDQKENQDKDRGNSDNQGSKGMFQNFKGKFFSNKNFQFGEKNKEDKNKLNHKGFGVAKVTSVSSTRIVAESVVGKNERTWTIETDSKTEFKTRTGENASIKDINEGDTITFMGVMEKRTDVSREVDDMILKATTVRIWGDVDIKAKAKVTGTVASIDEDDSQLVIKTDAGEAVTINSSDLTVIRDENGDKIDFEDIDVNSEIKVKGFWNTLKTRITTFFIKVM